MVMSKVMRKSICMCLILAKYLTRDAKTAFIHFFLPPPQPEPLEQEQG